MGESQWLCWWRQRLRHEVEAVGVSAASHVSAASKAHPLCASLADRPRHCTVGVLVACISISTHIEHCDTLCSRVFLLDPKTAVFLVTFVIKSEYTIASTSSRV